MSTSSISITLQFSSWNQNTRMWQLPVNSINPNKLRLWVNDKEINSNKFKYASGKIELIDTAIEIDEASIVNAEIELAGFAKTSPQNQAIFIALIGIIPALLTFISTLKFTPSHDKNEISEYNGKSLVSYVTYPVSIDKNDNSIYLNKNNLLQSIAIFTETNDYKAATDLAYLVKRNQSQIDFSNEEALKFKNMINKYNIDDYTISDKKREHLFSISGQTVDALGDMFPKIEFVLHDARDPLHSVVKIKNNITERKIGSPATHLGIELIKKYAQTSLSHDPLISYQINYKTQTFKSSTIPLYDPEIGLFGFICVNLDVTNLKDPNSLEQKRFIEVMTKIEDKELGEILKR